MSTTKVSVTTTINVVRKFFIVFFYITKDKSKIIKSQLAQINVAKMKGVNIDDPIMKEFVDNLDRINSIAEQSDGFVWRLTDESNNATSFNPYQNEQIIINISVWRDIDSLKQFVYNSDHASFIRRRKEWFTQFGKAFFCMWWIPEGQMPTLDNATERLDHLQANGPSEYAFDFRTIFEQ